MRYLCAILVYLAMIFASAQEMTTVLNGFKLKQFRETASAKYGMPLEEKKFDDGFEYELFLVKKDSSAYMIFEYPSWSTDLIWSIQFYGSGNSYNFRFNGVEMGMTKPEIEQILGPPSETKDIGEYGEVLYYKNHNYSLEVNPDGKLSSIKITDQSDTFYPEMDLAKFPDFNTIVRKLQSSSNREMSTILAPDLEVYSKNKAHFFKNNWEQEIYSDTSGIFELIRKNAKGLEKIDLNNEDEVEVNMRYYTDPVEVRNVMKFKSHPKIKEIVWNWEFGQFLIWEITLK